MSAKPKAAPQPKKSPIATPGAETARPKSQLLDTEAAADYLDLKPRTLEQWRCNKAHEIPYVKVGALVRYRQCDLDAWLESRLVTA